MMTGNQCDIFPCFLSEERMLQGSWLPTCLNTQRLGQTFQKKKGVDFMDILTSGLWNHQKENVICSKYSVWFVGGQRQEVFDGKNDSGW